MAWFQDLARNLGTQNAPFGFAPVGSPSQGPVDPAYNAGMDMIGNIGMGMLASGSRNPLQAFGRSYLGAQEQAQDQNKNQYIAAQMMQAADEKKRQREDEQAAKAEREAFLKTLPPDVQMKARSIPGYLDSYIEATDPNLQQPAKMGYHEINGKLVDDNGNVVYDGGNTLKPPLGYRYTADGNLEAVKGGPADPHVKATAGAGGVTTKMRNDAVSVKQAYDSLDSALTSYRDLIVGTKDSSGKSLTEGTGVSLFPGQENDQISQARTNLQLQLKELYNLGVLNGPDLSLMENMIFDPQVSWNPMNTAGKLYSAAGGPWSTSIEDRAATSIDNLKKTLKTIVDNKTKGILDAPVAPDVGGVPDGLTPEEWSAMSEEDRALWQ